MRLATPFSPLEVGEVDNFAYDFTQDVGPASIVFTVWTCSLQPYGPGTDPNPQSRVVELSNPTSIQVRMSNNVLQTIYGVFAVAQVGPLPASAAGGTYILDAAATLTDGRIIALNSTIQCVIPGEF